MAKQTNPEALAELQNLLRDTAKSAPQRTASIYETVKGLLPDIRELKAKRFTDAEIRDMFAEKGFEISLGTFRQYLQRANREEGVAPTRTTPKPRARIKQASEVTETKPDANAGAKANDTKAAPDANATPKPSELAVAPRAKTGAGAKATGHRLNDADL